MTDLRINQGQIEWWHAGTHIATLTLKGGILHLVCQPGWEPIGAAIEPQRPFGVIVELRPEADEAGEAV